MRSFLGALFYCLCSLYSCLFVLTSCLSKYFYLLFYLAYFLKTLLVPAGSSALLVGVCSCVFVGIGYLHALNLVPCWLVSARALWLVLVGSGYLHTLNLVPCWLVSPCACWLVCLVVRACWKWLPAYLEPRACWFVWFVCLVVGVLVGSGYLHALNLVPCWLVSPCGSCLLEVVTCMP